MRFCQSIGLLMLALVTMSHATHFRYGTISWEQVAGGNGRRVLFTIEMAWRKSFFKAGRINVGDYLTEGSLFKPDEKGPTVSILKMNVDIINEQSDWFIAIMEFEHEYKEDGSFIAAFEGCCRISTLLNNRDIRFRVSTQVVVESGVTRQSITTTTTPIQTAIVNEPIDAQIIALSNDNGDLTYRIATALESVDLPTYQTIDGFSIDRNNGIMSWTPTLEGLYTTQIVIEGREDPNSDDPDTFVVVDFIFSVIQDTGMQCHCGCANYGDPCVSDDNCVNCKSNGVTFTTSTCIMNSAPRFTTVTANGVDYPAENIVQVRAVAGEEFTLVVSASDPDSDDTVTIVSTAIPSGSDIEIIEDNVATSTLTYTPADEEDNFLLCYSASDCASNTAPGQVCVSVEVEEGELDASGDGLTFTVAGQTTVFNIHNVAGRLHDVAIEGTSQSSTAVVTALGAGEYVATYNINTNTEVSSAGFYALTITDRSDGQSLAYSLLCAPAETSPTNALLYDQGSTGLTGGSSESSVRFLVQSRDSYDNNVVDTLGGRALSSPLGTSYDSYSAQVSFAASSDNAGLQQPDFDEVQAIGQGQGTGVYLIEYGLPNVVVDDEYTLTVYHTNSSSGVKTTVSTMTLKVFGEEFTATFSGISSTITAGQPFSFDLEADDGQEHVFTVTVLDEEATVVHVSDGLHRVTANAVTVADAYLDSIVAVAPGLRGSTRAGFEVFPAAPSGADCVVEGEGISEAEAGEVASFGVRLFDEFENRITEQVDHILVSISSVSSTSESYMTFDTDEFVFEYTRETAEEVTIELTLNSTGELIANSPYTFIVGPGLFSFSASTLNGELSITAGDLSRLVVTAHDGYGNNRPAGEDLLQANLVQSDTDGNRIIGDAIVGSSVVFNEYFVTISGTTKGVYSLEVDVYVYEQSRFLEFKDTSVRIIPGPIVPENGEVTGEGLNGGVEGEEVLILLQSRDTFENVIEDKGEEYYLVRIETSIGTEFYSASYTFPGGIRDQNSSITSLFKKFAGLQTASDLSVEERNLADEGFWRIAYPVPEATGEDYNITIGYVDRSLVTSNMTGEEIFALNATLILMEDQATASPRTGGGDGGSINAFSDDWEVIAISVGAGATVLSMLGYGAWRLQRYRPKYLEQRKRAASAERALAEMGAEIDIIQGGRDFEAVGAATVSANPLHPAYQLKHGPNEELVRIDVPQDAVTPQAERGAFRVELAPQRPQYGFEADLE